MKGRYVSYFQSVITIGILSQADNEIDALNKAKEKINNSEEVNHCFFDQTDFEPVATEAWNPELESDWDESGLKFNFVPNEKTKSVIATRLQKSADDLTNEDYERFVKESIQNALVG